MKAFITASISDEVLEELQKKMEVTYESWRDTGNIYFDIKEMVEKLRGYDVFITVADDLKKAELFEQTNLKLIASCRGDPFNINLDAATKKNIPIIYTPNRNVVAVAELTVGLIISMARNLTKLDRFLHSENFEIIEFEDWINCYNKFMGSELENKTIGIVGFGQIGQRVAERLKPFGVKFLIYDPYVSEEIVKDYGDKTDIDFLMKESDFITLHAVATDENDNLINENRIKMMKSSGFLINLAKGSLVDYDYLYGALKKNEIAGAALDVFPLEPIDEDNEFLELDNVIVMPHIGGNTTEVVNRQSKMLLKDINMWLNNGIPSHVLNPEVFEEYKEKKEILDKPSNKFKEEIVKICKKLLSEGHVIGSAGNVSMRIKKGDEEFVLITPSNVIYKDMEPKDILIIDLEGKVIEGERNPSVEKHLHLGIYKDREDVNAIIHSHGMYSTILSTLNLSLPPIMEELVPYLGGEVLCSDYGEAGSEELADNVKASLEDRSAVILANHGSLCCGSHLEGAYTVLQYLERGSKTYYLAKLIKEPNLLPEDTIDYEMDIFELFKDSKKI
ncbi:MAG: class II aldolase/adducin family protein [Candidatus Lokiarchaeota archaeon]|nr:class II aldolase/adducin family protein [Candidatus Lokiarchaeota archaeon]